MRQGGQFFDSLDTGIGMWPIPVAYDDDRQLEKLLFKQAGRPPQDTQEPDFSYVSRELKSKGVTLTLLWQEYRAAHPDGYEYTWFCTNFAAYEQIVSPRYRNRHEAGATMQTDYAGHTVPLVSPQTGEIRQAQIFVAVLPASNLIFSYASESQKLPDWIEGQKRALNYFGGVTKAIAPTEGRVGATEGTVRAAFFAASAHRLRWPWPVEVALGSVDKVDSKIRRSVIQDCFLGGCFGSRRPYGYGMADHRRTAARRTRKEVPARAR